MTNSMIDNGGIENGGIEDGGELLRQARICRAMDSPFTASMLEAAKRQLRETSRTGRRIADWPGNRGHAAVALRLAGGFHALARAGASDALTALYQNRTGDFDRVVADILSAQDAFLAGWLNAPPQTNEVGRAAAIMAALLMASARFGQPFELLELGSSAGLNLNLHRYAYDLGGVAAGDPASALRIRPEWRGPPPPNAKVEILRTRGVDIAPIALADPAQGERLMAYVWADRDDRMARLEQAIAIARAHPPALDRGNAAAWIADRLREPQAEGVTRAIFHSIVLQYIPAEGQAKIRAAILEAGQRATAARPLAWISFEWDEARNAIHLKLSCWPGDGERDIATCHPHAQWIEWHEPRHIPT
ncbi:DUF2332 domain-containing protein [Sphingobium aquiterrae]|uniref:DUF2332 domain-containing protein n=1 Tax=Sphingobium aquiterrae TaxID=2038656 RepID=UPI003018E0CE